MCAIVQILESNIFLGIVAGNFVHFRGSQPLLPDLSPASVRLRGGGYVGYIRKALEEGYSE